MTLLRRAARGLSVVVLSLFVVACGPGVGGTGTGYGDAPGLAGLAWFDAQADSVCNGPVAGLLACSATTSGAVAVPTRELRMAGPCAAATLAGDDIVLDVICGGWVFAGRWGRDGAGVGRYYGLIGTDPLVAPTDPGTLEVQVDGERLVAWLRDAQGALVAGPLVLDPAGSASGWRSE